MATFEFIPFDNTPYDIALYISYNLKYSIVMRIYHMMKGVIGLSFQLAKAEFKLRNEGSYLGIVWYLLNPILTFGILFFVFADRLGQDISYYPLYLFLGITIFNVFQTTIIEASRSILREYHYLIKSINFSLEALIFSIVLKNIFSHIFEIILFTALLIYFGISVVSILWYIPICIILIIFIYGASLIVSATTVYAADLDNIWNFLTRILWFGTPIFYSLEIGSKLEYLNWFNPMYYFITAARESIIYHTIPSPAIIIGMLVLSLGGCAIGLWVFILLKRKFAERI